MAVMAPINLSAPFEVDRLLEIRTSHMKKLPGSTILSGIDKELRTGSLRVTKLGLEGDEHDPTFHGGLDKAILGYCSSHYPGWREAHPDRADRFVPGGFGENFVTERMNERNVCIGDVISVGPEVVLQVSLPRQPCFKLNHRFSLKNFAPTVYKTSRTGWYYRVLQEGRVTSGDECRLVERKWPEWTVERVQEYLHRVTDNHEMNEKLSEIEALGKESRGQFQKRVAKARKKSVAKKDEIWHDFKVTSRKMETPRIVSLVLEAVKPDPDFEGFPLGAHARIKLPNGLLRTYSVVSREGKGPEALRKIELGVALDEKSRGGSRYIHESVHIGDVLQVGRITTDVNVASAASNHVYIAGGIGLTAFLDMMKESHSVNYSVQLHYAIRSADDIPFRDRLEPFGDCVVLYDKSKGQRMDIKQILKDLPWNSQLYFCGPQRMMEAGKEAVEEICIPQNEVHFEAFAADITGDPFEVEISNANGKVLQVGEEESLLEVLRREFGAAASSCEVGNCGTCKLTVKAGQIDHRGTALSPDEKASSMLACVSRGIGRIAIEVEV